jgi:hypothetical protein
MQELRIEHAVGTNSKLDRAMAALFRGATVRVTTASVTPPPAGDRCWSCEPAEHIAATAPTPARERAARERARPVVVRDPVLGQLVLDRQLGAFVGHRTLAGKRYDLAIAQTFGADAAADVPAQRQRIIAFEGAQRRIIDSITHEMLALYNDTWRGDRPQMSQSQLAGRLRLASVHVGPGDRTTAYFDVGEMFEGHVVEVRLGPDADIREITLGGSPACRQPRRSHHACVTMASACRR